MFVSSTLAELAAERAAVCRAVTRLHLTPVMFELGASPHPPRDLYRAYLAQSDVFLGIYWESYGWVAPQEDLSGLEDEFRLSAAMPRLLYVKETADRDPRLEAMLEQVRQEGAAAYKTFSTPDELERFVADDLAVLLSERFWTAVEAEPVARGSSRSQALIAPDNPIIGREAELAEVTALLVSPEVRLATLTGPVGVGKSRLALELAGLLGTSYPDGVWIVLLESLRDPTQVLPTIARVLGVEISAHEPPLASLTASIGERPVFLVLDNFEHVAGAALDIADLLGSCPLLSALVTSRTPLLARGEHEYRVGPLAIPDPDRTPVEELRRSPAVRLFLERAEAAGASVDHSDDDLRAVAHICRHLDGLPLAIELAVSRSQFLPPRQLLPRLEQRLKLLTGGSRDAPERHRSLRAAIDWGHELLGPGEQVALRRLAVFSGGWTLGAGEQVLLAAGPLEPDPLTVLESLLLASFVARSPVVGPEPRYALLETIREYAGEKLTASPDLQASGDAHAAYFLAFAEQALPETYGPDQAAWLDALERDHGNLREALRWFADREDVDRQLRLTAALGRFWYVHRHLREALAWLGRGRERAEGRQDAVAAEVLSWLGVLALAAGDIDLAAAAHDEALPVRRALGDHQGEHREMLALGNIAFVRGDLDTAEERWRELVRLAEQRGDDDPHGVAYNNLGYTARVRGDLPAARRQLERALELHEAARNPHSATIDRLNLSGVLHDLGDEKAANDLAVDVVRRASALGDSGLVAEALEIVAGVAAATGRPLDAAWLYGAAETPRRRLTPPRLPIETALYDRDVRRARDAAAALDQGAAFGNAWRDGAAATLDQAAAVALGSAEVGDFVVR